jgi:hypothetical protein
VRFREDVVALAIVAEITTLAAPSLATQFEHQKIRPYRFNERQTGGVEFRTCSAPILKLASDKKSQKPTQTCGYPEFQIEIDAIDVNGISMMQSTLTPRCIHVPRAIFSIKLPPI